MSAVLFIGGLVLGTIIGLSLAAVMLPICKDLDDGR